MQRVVNRIMETYRERNHLEVFKEWLNPGPNKYLHSAHDIHRELLKVCTSRVTLDRDAVNNYYANRRYHHIPIAVNKFSDWEFSDRKARIRERGEINFGVCLIFV